MSMHHRSAILSPLVLAACAAAGGEVLVSSWATHDVRRFDTETGAYLGQLVTSRSGGLDTPNGLAWGPDGNLYVSSANTSQVLRYDGRSGAFIDAFAGAPIDRASFVGFGPDEMMYVCSTNDDRVLRFDGDTGAFLGVFAEGPEMDWPAGLTWRQDDLLVSNFGGGGILRYDAPSGRFLGALTDEPAKPLYTRIADDGSVWVCDFSENRLVRYDGATGASLQTVSGAALNGPVGQALLGDGSILVASFNNSRLVRFDEETGEQLGFWTGVNRPNDLLPVPHKHPQTREEPSRADSIGARAHRW